MRWTAPIVLVCLIGRCLTSVSQAEESYTRTTDLAPTAITYSDLGNLLDAIHAETASVGVQTDKPTLPKVETLEIGTGGTKFTLDGDVSASALIKAPAVGYELTYGFRQLRGPISEVRLTLTDDYRRLEVSGVDRDQVDALFTNVKEKLEQRTIWWGGTLRRGALCLFVALCLFIIPFFPYGEVQIGFNLRTLMLGLACAISVGWLLLPTDEWLPGFAIYSGDASFIVRNTAYITFAGLVAAFVVPLIGFLWTKSEVQPIRNAPEEPKPTASDTHTGWTGKHHNRNIYRVEIQNRSATLKLYCYMWTPEECFGEVILELPDGVRKPIAMWDESSTRNHTLPEGCGAGNSGVSSTQDDLIQRTPLRDCLIVDIAEYVSTVGSYKIEFRYKRGANGTWVQRVEVRS